MKGAKKHVDEWRASLDAYILTMRMRPDDPRLRDPIQRPPTNPAPMPKIPQSDRPTSWDAYYKAMAAREEVVSDLRNIRAPTDGGAENPLDDAWSLYWSDLAERIEVLFARRRRPPKTAKMAELRVDAVLKLGARNRLQMFAIEWPRAVAGTGRAAERYQKLFDLIDTQIAKQATRNVAAAVDAVHRALNKKSHPKHYLLCFANGKEMTAKSLRETFERVPILSEFQVHEIDRWARIAIRRDLLRVAKRHLPRSPARQPKGEFVIFWRDLCPDFQSQK